MVRSRGSGRPQKCVRKSRDCSAVCVTANLQNGGDSWYVPGRVRGIPLGSPLSDYREQDRLDVVAASHNDRLRKTLGFATPNEEFAKLVANLDDEIVVSNCGVRYGT